MEEENKVPEDGNNIPENNISEEDITVSNEDTVSTAETTGLAAENKKEEPKEGSSVGTEIFEWVQALVVAFVVAMFLRTFVFTMVYVDGQSMEPTLHNAERMVVSRLSNDSLKYGDVIIFRPVNSPETPYVKRIIATEGQTVSFDYKKGLVIVDGKTLDEPYVMATIEPDRFGDFSKTGKSSEVVPKNCVFVMGDNRNNSYDSRYDAVGVVPINDILGKAVVRVWPVNKIGTSFKDIER
ncbi:MAG: signal peptidase I [Bacillota bacterium]|nr:signal peptidase I [Bacillota bacterium]